MISTYQSLLLSITFWELIIYINFLKIFRKFLKKFCLNTGFFKKTYFNPLLQKNLNIYLMFD